jgi:hypothetical protein
MSVGEPSLVSTRSLTSSSCVFWLLAFGIWCLVSRRYVQRLIQQCQYSFASLAVCSMQYVQELFVTG